MVSLPPAELIEVAGDVVAGDRDWRIVELDPPGHMAWLVHYTKRMRFADDVVVRVYALPDGRSSLRAVSRSRIGIGDFGQNARNLTDLVSRLRTWLDRQGVPWQTADGSRSP